MVVARFQALVTERIATVDRAAPPSWRVGRSVTACGSRTRVRLVVSLLSRLAACPRRWNTTHRWLVDGSRVWAVDGPGSVPSDPHPLLRAWHRGRGVRNESAGGDLAVRLAGRALKPEIANRVPRSQTGSRDRTLSPGSRTGAVTIRSAAPPPRCRRTRLHSPRGRSPRTAGPRPRPGCSRRSRPTHGPARHSRAGVPGS